MSSSLAFRTELTEIDTYLPLSESLAFELEQFTRNHYRVTSHQFNENILALEKSGSLGVFYDLSNKIVGFTRICRNFIRIQDRDITAHTGGTYYNPKMDLSFTAARFCLSKAMRYKLEHPYEEMVFFALANTPSRYQFLAKLNSDIYPQANQPIPEFVLELVEHIKSLYHWETDNTHPMLINSQMPLLNPPTLEDTSDSLIDYYLSLNPNYYMGTSLLIYLPIDLTNISQGIKRVLMQMRPVQTYKTREAVF